MLWWLRQESVPYFFQLLKATCIPWFVALSSIFKAHHSNSWFHCHISSCLFCSKDAYDYTGLTRIIPDQFPPYLYHNSLSHLQSPFFSHEVALTGFKTWIFGGDYLLISPLHKDFYSSPQIFFLPLSLSPIIWSQHGSESEIFKTQNM